ncbi:hypothetical protein NKH37_15720 [Mesorhizobium sp. M1217]|uniref:hypothetical protein n=1 Tax=Mesorhizobium sp. M1217 TaxID=2957070 RepID=UPI00333D1390
MTDRKNYNREHVSSGGMISGSSSGLLTVGDLRDAISLLPDDARVIFGTCSHGDPLTFYRFKMRGESIISIELG